MRVANAKELTKMTRMLVLVIAGLMSPQDFVCRVGKTNVHASFVAVYVQDSLEFAPLTCDAWRKGVFQFASINMRTLYASVVAPFSSCPGFVSSIDALISLNISPESFLPVSLHSS
jgi:hypothetical protein